MYYPARYQLGRAPLVVGALIIGMFLFFGLGQALGHQAASAGVPSRVTTSFQHASTAGSSLTRGSSMAIREAPTPQEDSATAADGHGDGHGKDGQSPKAKGDGGNGGSNGGGGD